MFGIDDAVLVPAAVSAVSAGLNYFGNQDRNQTQIDLANQANTFSAQQYANRYQTTVKDLEAAGLNPMLAYGAGAGSPPSAVSPAVQTNKFEGLPQHIQSAVGAAGFKKDQELKDQQIIEGISRVAVNEQQAQNLDADTKLKILASTKVPYEIKQIVSQTLLNDAKRTATNAEELATRSLMPKYQSEGNYYHRFGIAPWVVKDGATALNAAGSFVRSIKAPPTSTTTSTNIGPQGQSTHHISTTKYGE